MANKEITRLVQEGIVEKSNSSIISSAFLLTKKNKSELRLVVDYKETNKHIRDGGMENSTYWIHWKWWD